MINIRKADGSTIKAIYDFLISINQKDQYITIKEFSVELESNINSQRSVETFKSIEDFLNRFLFVLDLITPQCELGPYFRLIKLQLESNKNSNKSIQYFNYDKELKIWILISKFEKADFDSDYWMRELIKHSNRQEFLIELRKSRYVDPCYVDEKYIDEKYSKYY